MSRKYHEYISIVNFMPKFEEYVSGIRIEYNKKIHKCPDNYCNRLKNNKLNKIESDIEYIKYDIDNNNINDYYYDNEEEEYIECSCGNEIKFTYNPYEIIKKYL